MPTVCFNHNKSIPLSINMPLTELDDVIDFGCRVGACGACAIKVIQGSENLSAMSEDERDFITMLDLGEGIYRLACQCKILGDITISTEK